MCVHLNQLARTLSFIEHNSQRAAVVSIGTTHLPGDFSSRSRHQYVRFNVHFTVSRMTADGMHLVDSTTHCIILKSWETFIHRFEWSITTAYCISASIDILISTSLSYFLRKQKRRTDIAAASQLLDTITTYTINSGALTCLFALMSLISHILLRKWFAFRGTLVFLGTHFLIGKLYTCAVLTTYASDLRYSFIPFSQLLYRLLMRRFLRERYSKTLSTGLRVRAPKSPHNYEFSTPMMPDSAADSEFVLTPPNSARLMPHKSSKGSFEPLKIKMDVDHVTISYDQSAYEPTETVLTNRAVTDTVDIEARSMI
ncbi:hypothetical protein EWM64_g101 [Hericium alpestre]|uniref:DUF6534 domain-containing protein n=1 Tax=Hericium alpestre TaxID=135208 RepID=A0A4Z0AD97_9AGAM|nr:hypothetical protein EWM64_g101 [Hericium alpestre]